jgi:hypothetical protein
VLRGVTVTATSPALQLPQVVGVTTPRRVSPEPAVGRGLNSKLNAFGGLAFNDPNGLEIGIAGEARETRMLIELRP